MPRTAQHPEEADYTPSLAPAHYSSSVERGLLILDCFTPTRQLLGVKEIARELGMSPSTTHRYLATLLELGYLRQEHERRYRLTLAVTRLGLSALSATSLREHARPYLQDLRTQTTHTTAIAVLDGPTILYADRLASLRHRTGPLDLGAGSRLPAHCTAMGKVLLAHLPAHAQRTLIREMRLQRHTANTITTKTRLRTELQHIAQEGIATNDRELPGVHAIAAPICDATEAHT